MLKLMVCGERRAPRAVIEPANRLASSAEAINLGRRSRAQEEAKR